MFIAYVEEGLFVYCLCGRRIASCLLPLWKNGYLFIAHVEEGLFVYYPCGRRTFLFIAHVKEGFMLISLKGYLFLPMWKEKGYFLPICKKEGIFVLPM